MSEKNTQIIKLLHDGLTFLDIGDKQEQLQKYLLQYIHELEMFNAAFNLVKVKTTEELVIKHVLDSLAPWKLFAETIHAHHEEQPFTFADIGSGAGFPGIPLACLFLLKYPHVRFTLIERMHKRCSFLENVCAIIGLTNTAIAEVEVEKAPTDYFDIAVFRAFSPLDHTLLQVIQKRIRNGGLIAAYKGKQSEIEKELHALGAQQPAHNIIPITLPFSAAERNLVVISKESIL